MPGRAEQGIVEIEPLFLTDAGELRRASGYPPHQERFVDHGYDLSELLASTSAGAL
ncbi:MAG TPA: hypothetical protein VMT88_07025 [Actinomycetes bacterium]|nr:hypothetical protein [Actinomycetes bacterium]